MSEICKKYDIPETTFKAMVKDGIISTTWPFYDEVIIYFKQNKHLGKPEAIKMASDKFKISERQVYNIIGKI